ncbi:ATP-binding protein [Pseudomonas chlororaphis]|uniref:ATP-binding protein n=1 Tax=Pseudomonas chlororaphis TaxID=587753 RepID=UPI003D0E5FC6
MNRDSYPSAKPVVLVLLYQTVQAHQHATTTNLSLSKWLNTSGNVKMTIALLDCLINHCHTAETGNEHYRRQHSSLIDTQMNCQLHSHTLPVLSWSNIQLKLAEGNPMLLYVLPFPDRSQGKVN